MPTNEGGTAGIAGVPFSGRLFAFLSLPVFGEGGAARWRGDGWGATFAKQTPPGSLSLATLPLRGRDKDSAPPILAGLFRRHPQRQAALHGPDPDGDFARGRRGRRLR